MVLDVRIAEAIKAAVAEAGQPEALALRMIAWFEEVTSGNEDIHDQAAVARHLEVLFEGTVFEGHGQDEH